MKVMVVDDDRALRKILSTTIEKWGYETITAADGAEALEHLRSNNPPRIMILDIMMPNLNGIEVCEQLDSLGKQLIYTIMLTAVSNKDNLVKTLEAGAHDFLSKPVDMRELKCRIEVGARLVKSEDIARKNQLFLEAATEGADLGLWEVDVANRTIIVNKRMKELIGLKVGYTISVDDWYKIVHPEDLPEVLDRVNNKFESLTKGYTTSYRIKDSNGNWRWVQMAGRALKAGSDNRNTRICGILQDISRQKEEENRLFESVRLSAVLSLAGGIAHNFNNLNTGISGFLHLALRDTTIGEKTRERIGTALESLEEINHITESLLRFSGQRQESSSQESDLRQIITDILTLMQPSFDSNEINLLVKIDEAPKIECNVSGISQALYSIIENAYHAVQECQNKSIRITCFIEKSEAVIIIADTGIGISSKNLNKIFTPFFSTKGEHAEYSSSQSQFEGLGLGLPMTKNIITRHHGTINVSSELGEGTSVTIRLPMIQPPGTKTRLLKALAEKNLSV